MRHQIFERTLHPSGYACFSVLNTPHAPSGRVVAGPSPAPSNGRRRLKSGVQSSPSFPTRPSNAVVGGRGAAAGIRLPAGAPTLAAPTGSRCPQPRFSVSPRFYTKSGSGSSSPLTRRFSLRAIGAFVSWCGGLVSARGPVLYKPATTTTAATREPARPREPEHATTGGSGGRGKDSAPRAPRTDRTQPRPACRWQEYRPTDPQPRGDEGAPQTARRPPTIFTMGPEIKQEDPLDLSI